MLGTMELAWLLFDFSDEESGSGSFDAMACVTQSRLPDLVSEVEAVLRWAHDEFGPPSTSEGEGDWDFERHDAAEPDGRTTLTLTIGGSRTFCEAFRHAFPAADM
jgi:hypothetical protein